MRITIIGGGASGLVAAIYASKKHEVTLLERNPHCGKKLLLTGNGRCNYWNENIDYKNYLTDEDDVLKEIITDKNKQEILGLFDTLGIIPQIKDSYYYPYSNKAASINEALLLEARLNGVNIINEFLVEDIIKKDNVFIINPNKEKLKSDKVILAAGSNAYPKTGSDGIGYILASKFNHHIIKPMPSLTSLITKPNLKECKGIRCDVVLNLCENENLIKKEQGQIQITDNGISGICAFNLSGYINKGLTKNKKEKVLINFVPFLNCDSTDEVLNFLEEREEVVTGRNIEQFLEGFLDYHIVKYLLKKASINPSKYPNELSKKEKYTLAQNLYSLPLEIIGTDSFDHAQVCIGGVDLKEINPKTMESKLEKGLYFTGELLDVAGPCGGHNLAFAFISGMLAGKGIDND